jgi:ABC-type dipeptide/oligopeptide/nickel transport system ATPase subunit
MSDHAAMPVVQVQAVTHFYGRRASRRAVLANVSFDVAAGRTTAVIGESGAGKSTLTRLIAGLERPSEGAVLIDGAPAGVRTGHVSPVQMVFQHPREALNRFASIGSSVGEPLRSMSKAERRRRVAALLESVGIDSARMSEKPASFSGGQLQRIVTARALAADPKVLLCDEPTSALDVSVQAQIVNLLLALQESKRFAMILVTHDLGVAKVMADDVVVLRHGKLVERAPTHEFFRGPREPYSRELLDATAAQILVHKPTNDRGVDEPGSDPA